MAAPDQEISSSGLRFSQKKLRPAKAERGGLFARQISGLMNFVTNPPTPALQAGFCSNPLNKKVRHFCQTSKVASFQVADLSAEAEHT